jgi:glycine betaine/proline transport system substrate-binding protein
MVKRLSVAFVAVTAAIALTACAGEKVGTTPPATAAPCGTVNIASNAWVGYTANLAVVSYVLKTKLGCEVKSQDLAEEVSWQGISSGTIDVILENWGHDDLKKKYIDTEKVAVEMGVTGNKGIIGWYVPPWLAAAHPDILDWQNLNKYAKEFATSETGGLGQILDGDPSYVTNDEALVKNLNLNFKVVYAGSEDALIAAFRTAEQQKKWLIGYFYEPQWFLADVPLKHVTLPAYTPGCDADAAAVKCDYPPYDLDKVARKAWVDSGVPAVTVVKNFSWTNDDQNAVAKDITGGMSNDDAAKKWVDAHPDVVKKWLEGTGVS